MFSQEPNPKRTIVFVDGQNLFYGAKHAFGYKYPNYDVKTLAEKICTLENWELTQIRFYTGVPDINDNKFWHIFWTNKLASMGQKGIEVYSRKLKYRNQTVTLPSGQKHTTLVGQEKGVDVRIALDIMRLAREKVFDVCLVISQDQDLSEVADEVRIIAMDQQRWIKIASGFPISPTYQNTRGVNKTDWITVDRALYDSCIDPNDYR